MSPNEQTIRQLFAAMDAGQSMDPLAGVAAPEYTGYFPGAPPMPVQGIQQIGNGFFAACPGLTHTIEDVIADGDKVATRMTIRGAQTRPMMTPGGELPPSGKSFALNVLNMYRFSGGKIVEQRVAFDMMDFLKQIGAMP